MACADTFTCSLTPTQQGVLIDALIRDHPSAAIDQIVIDLHEPVDPETMEQAWRRVVAHYPSLRTCFRWQGLTEPVQEAVPTVDIEFQRHDLRDCSETARAAALREFLEVDRRRGIDKSRAPLLRLTLFRIGEAHWRLVWTFSMMVCDGHSTYRVIQDVFRIYEGLRAGAPIELPPPVPFAPFIDWLRSRDAAADERFWRGVLAGFTQPIQLTIGRSTAISPKGYVRRDEEILYLTEAETAALKEFAKAQSLSLNVLVHAAWALMLHRYSGERDIVFGTVRAGRRDTIANIEQVVGLFLNNIPVRAQIDPALSLLEWLRGLRDHMLAARHHEHASLTSIHRWSEIPAGRELFETLVIFDRAQMDAVFHALGGAWAQRHVWPIYNSGYPITLYAYAEPTLALKIAYDTDRFDAAAIGRMLDHLRVLLRAMAANPDRRLADIPLLTQAEEQRLRHEWNATERPWPQDMLVHRFFEQQAAAQPDATALICDDRALSYRDLDARANQLANHLVAQGIGPGALVGIHLDRSFELVIAVLAILKAGAAYVPLDPNFPAKRIADMIEDAKLRAIVSNSWLVARLSEPTPPSILLDRDHAAIAAAGSVGAGARVTATDLAYVLYTSGSTGRPKGVMVEHRNVGNFFAGMDECIGRGTGVWLAVTSLSFDISVLELLWTLGRGFSVVIDTGEERATGPDHRSSTAGRPIDYGTAALMRRHGVTHLQCTPSMARMLTLDPEAHEGLSRLQVLMIGGEAFPPALCRELRSLVSGRLLNMYGPTETTIWSTVHEIDEVEDTVPIGRPIANTQVHVLDALMRQVPVGVAGELYIGGAGVVRGYLGRPELTAERFVPDPFAGSKGARMYRTGDRVYWREDGTLAFLGRVDFQVKLRGHRIELGEVEAVLSRHRGVRDAVTAVRDDSLGGQRLIAYVVPAGGEPPRAEALRTFLEEQLPPYMVPSAFMTLAALPLTPNGKVDRLALPEPGVASAPAAASAELGEIEAVLRENPEVADAAVARRGSASGDARLIAYIVRRGATTATGSELRRFLRERLPECTLPQFFVDVETLPRRADGEIDRAALTDPFGGTGATADSFIAPRTPSEQLVAAIWRELLGVERVGVYDNFFNLGGHSLLVMHSIARIEEATGIRLSFRDVVTTSLENLAAILADIATIKDAGGARSRVLNDRGTTTSSGLASQGR